MQRIIAHRISQTFCALNLSEEAQDGTAKPEGFCGKYAPENALDREVAPHHKKQFYQDQNPSELLRPPRRTGLLSVKAQKSRRDEVKST